MTKKEASNFLTNHILRAVRNDIGVLVRSKDVFFAIPREVYAALEYLAKLNEGRNTDVYDIANFITQYFPKENQWYRKFPQTLSIIFRHGGFHKYFPVILNIDGVDVVTILGRGRKADSFLFKGIEFYHLKPKDCILPGIEYWSETSKRRVTGSLRALWIPISVKALYYDLISSINNFGEDLRKNFNKKKGRFEGGLSYVFRSESENYLLREKKYNKKELNILKGRLRKI